MIASSPPNQATGAKSSVAPAAGSLVHDSCSAFFLASASSLTASIVGVPAMRRAYGRATKLPRKAPVSSTMLKSSVFQPSFLSGVHAGVYAHCAADASATSSCAPIAVK